MNLGFWNSKTIKLMKKNTSVLLPTLVASALVAAAGDPRIDSWLTGASGQYPRIYTSSANQASGNAVATWSNGSQT